MRMSTVAFNVVDQLSFVQSRSYQELSTVLEEGQSFGTLSQCRICPADARVWFGLKIGLKIGIFKGLSVET